MTTYEFTIYVYDWELSTRQRRITISNRDFDVVNKLYQTISSMEREDGFCGIDWLKEHYDVCGFIQGGTAITKTTTERLYITKDFKLPYG